MGNGASTENLETRVKDLEAQLEAAKKANVQVAKPKLSDFEPAIVQHFPASQPSRSVLFLCDLAKIPHKPQLVDLMKGKLSKENPLGAVPFLIDNQKNFSVQIGEGAAILIHLCETRGLTQFYPEDPSIRAKINYWMHWHHTAARSSTLNILRNLWFDTPTAKAEFVEGIKKILPIFHFLELSLKNQGTKFLVSDEVTIADLFLLPEIDQLDPILDAVFSDGFFPTVEAWLKNMQALPGYEENAKYMRQFCNGDLFKSKADEFVLAVKSDTTIVEVAQALKKASDGLHTNADKNVIDADGDGKVSFKEYQMYLQKEMKWINK